MPPGSQAALATVEAEPAILRVMAGPQRGAELPLNPGDYLIGSGEHCDAVISDPAVAEAHVLLSFGGDAVTVAAKERSVALAGRTLRPGESAEITLPAAVTFGLTSIAIGASDTDWSALTLPEPPGPEAAVEETAAAEGGENPDAESDAEEAKEGEAAEDGDAAEAGEADEAQSDEAAAEAAAPDGETAAAPEVPADQVTVQTQADKHPSRRWLWLLLLLGLVLAVAAFFVVRGQGDQEAEAESMAPAKATPHDAVVALLEDLGLTEVSVERSPTGSPVLTGYVPDATTHLELTLALQSAGLQAEDRTRDIEALMDAVALTLGSFSWPEPGFGAHLRPSYAGNGVVVIDGYLGPEVDRGVLSRRLKGDVPGMANLEYRRAGLMEWKSILDRRLNEAGLGQWLTTEPTAGVLRVSGEVTAKEAETWRAVGQGFVNESGGWPKLAIAVTSAGPPPNPTMEQPMTAPEEKVVGAEQIVGPEEVLDLEHPSVIGVILSQKGPGRVLLAGGLSLLEGETLENGMAVKSVMADKVVFNKGERELVVYVKESR